MAHPKLIVLAEMHPQIGEQSPDVIAILVFKGLGGGARLQQQDCELTCNKQLLLSKMIIFSLALSNFI